MAALTEQQIEIFRRDGILVIEDFLSQADVVSLRNACSKLVQDMDPNEHKGQFSTTDHQQGKDPYFLESGDKIRFFFEPDVFDEQGNLTKEKSSVLNKMGHSLHTLDQDFKRVSFSEDVQAVVRSLGMVDPAIIQGMYIFKQPGVGGAVTPHQDATFLYNSPIKLYGLWFPIDDATEENGCLWYVPGSHNQPVNRRYVRSNKNGNVVMTFRGEYDNYPDSAWVAAPVKKGALVLIHGQVYHKSEKNCSAKPRHAYTFHVIEMSGSKYSEENWLQPPEDKKLPRLFTDSY